jgi:hypothetical protein
MSNNVRHIKFASRPAQEKSVEPEPTELQRAVLRRARELRARERQPHKRSWGQWAGAAVMAVVSFGILYGVVDIVLRRIQHLAREFTSQPAVQPASQPSPSPQATEPSQPYYVEVQPPAQR